MEHKNHPTVRSVAEVSEREAKLVPYMYVYVNDDGSARELSPSERAYLETPFHPFDSGRPYVKSSYDKKDGRGRLSGFCLRTQIPSNIEIADAPPEDSIEDTK